MNTKDKSSDETQESEIKTKVFKMKYLQIFKGNKYYLLDRKKYDQNQIMMLLDLKKLNKLGGLFRQYEDGIEKTEFIRLVRKELGSNTNDPIEDTSLVYGLHKFFCEIDFNGDGHMQWEEFTQFIIDTVECESQPKAGENEDEQTSTKQMTEKIMQKYKRYEMSQFVKDYYIHKSPIIDAAFISKNEMLLICEYRSKQIKIYNPRSGKIYNNIDIAQYYKISKELSSLSYSSNQQTKAKKGDFKQNTTYSVLSICTYNWIIGVCLSNQSILFFNIASDGKSELLYTINTPSLQKRIWFLPDHNIWFSSGVKCDNDKYYYVNELDVEFEIINQKMAAYYNEGHCYRDSYCIINEHKGEIYDVIEIQKPYLILTACMDGLIRLINVNDKEYLKKWSNHSLGVKHLSYNPNIDSVGHILSTGFEYYISIFCTDLSIEEAYKGKLEGHYAPVITCQFLANSYMCASVDEEAAVRIWDCKLRLCLQMIPMIKKNFQANNLLFMPKLNKFILYGNKMLFYDAKYKEDEKSDYLALKEENFPIHIEFNRYYSEFFVVTFKDIRVYSKDGILTKIFRKCRENDHFEPDTKIKCFAFENNYRKFYVGYSNGAVMQYNAGNGSLIKPINEHEVEKDGLRTYRYDHSKEIISMFYFYQYKESINNFVLLTTSLDSLINMYNELNPEESEKLRTVKGGHTIDDKVCDILAFDFSLTLNIFATGSSGGLTVIWDFELTKIDDIFYVLPDSENRKLDVVYLKFLDTFPVLAVSYSDGSCYLWGVKPLRKEKGNNFFRFRNYYSTLYRVEVSSICSMTFINKELDEMNKSYKFKKFFSSNEEDVKLRKQKIIDELTGEELPEIEIADLYSQDTVEQTLNPDTYCDNSKLKYYLVVGDSKGYMKVLNVKGLIKKYGLTQLSREVIRSNFNLLKKEDINVETILNHNLKKNKELGKYINLYETNIIIREWKGHDDSITCIEVIDDPFAIISTARDRLMKIWNSKCELIGEIDVLPKLNKHNKQLAQWQFKINEKQLLSKEIKEVARLLEDNAIEPIILNSKEDEKFNQMKTQEDEDNDTDYPKTSHKDNRMKKRFKQIEPKKKDKKGKKEEEDDDGKLNNSYEGLYVQEITKQIDCLLNKEGPDEGMNKMSHIIIESITKPKEEKKQSPIKEDNPTQEDNKTFYQTKNMFYKTKSSLFQKQIPTNSGFRNTFYSEKFAKTKKKKNVKDNLLLPILKYDLKKKRERSTYEKRNTSKLLAYEFYNNSYKNCCSINPSSNVSNQSLAINYQNQWRYVDQFNSKMKNNQNQLARLKIPRCSSQKVVLGKRNINDISTHELNKCKTSSKSIFD